MRDSYLVVQGTIISRDWSGIILGPLRMKYDRTHVICRSSARTSQKTVCLHCREQLDNVVWGKRVAVCSEDRTNLTNGKQCGQNEEILEFFAYVIRTNKLHIFRYDLN
jgi:hypothetical protein